MRLYTWTANCSTLPSGGMRGAGRVRPGWARGSGCGGTWGRSAFAVRTTVLGSGTRVGCCLRAVELGNCPPSVRCCYPPSVQDYSTLGKTSDKVNSMRRTASTILWLFRSDPSVTGSSLLKISTCKALRMWWLHSATTRSR